LEYTDLKPYQGERVRIAVPDDSGIKSTFNWYGFLVKVHKDRVKLITDSGRVMFIKLDRILEFSTLRNGGA
jgi:hypothetical protein